MARNTVQFQQGLSEPAFQDAYGTEAQCLAELEALRWPDGFGCPRCGHGEGHRLSSRPRLHQCASCRHQASVTAGTVFHRTKLPLTIWFRGIYHLTQSKNGVSALELSRRLGVQYNTAWLLKHKLMHVMKEREADRQLVDRIEIDDAYLGGEKARKPGESGRGSPNKTPFVAAVETDEHGNPRRIAMQVVEGFTLAEIADFARRKLAPSCEVISDGLNCFPGVIAAGCSHSVHITGGGRRAAEAPVFKWVNTALGNIKSALTGTYRHHQAKHSPRYLAEFQYRFNRRFDLVGMFTRLAYVSVRTPPAPYELLTEAESRA